MPMINNGAARGAIILCTGLPKTQGRCRLESLNPNITVLVVASSARSIRRLKLARADCVIASAAVGSRLLANIIEGNPIPGEFRDLLEGKLQDT